MTPTDYAAEELELWRQALEEQCAAEAKLSAARHRWQWAQSLALLPQVRALRITAALLLANAVEAKLQFRHLQVLAERLLAGGKTAHNVVKGAGHDTAA